jgi:hypothetical protein
MRVAMLGINYRPEETVIAVFNTGRCEYLAERGHDVTIFTGFPYYPRWRVPNAYRGRLTAEEARRSVRIVRSWLYVPGRVITRRRMIHEASLVASAMRRAFADRPPVLLMTVSPHPRAGAEVGSAETPLGRPVPFPRAGSPARRRGRPRHDQRRLPRPAAKPVELAYQHATLVCTLIPVMGSGIVAKGVPAEKARPPGADVR